MFQHYFADVSNAILDGSDALMLSGETANGPYFEAAVTIMAKTCCEAEAIRNHDALYQAVINTIMKETGRLSVGEALASSAVKTSIDIDAAVIVVMSETGKMANYVAKFRPKVPILCLTPNLTAARQASGLMLGMHTIWVDSLRNGQELIGEITYELLQSGVATGSKAVLISGRLAGLGEEVQVVTLSDGIKPERSHIMEGGGFFFKRGLLLSYSE
jgi:pyruvate kinase